MDFTDLVLRFLIGKSVSSSCFEEEVSANTSFKNYFKYKSVRYFIKTKQTSCTNLIDQFSENCIDPMLPNKINASILNLICFKLKIC